MANLSSKQPDMGDSSTLLSLFSIGKLRQEEGLLRRVLWGAQNLWGLSAPHCWQTKQ